MDFFDCFQLIITFLFWLILIGRTVQMIRSGTNPIVLGMGKSGFMALLEKSIFLGLALWTFEVVTFSLGMEFHLFRESRLFSITPLRILGAILEVAGMVGFISAIFSFGRSWRIGIDTEGPGELVTDGIFSITRNPIFLFLDLFFLGTFLIYPTIFFAVSAFFVIFTNHLQLIREEKFLERKYGDKYLEYKKQVGRYL